MNDKTANRSRELLEATRINESKKTVDKLVVIIPALNEEKTIIDVIGKIPTNIDGISKIEIVIIDDGSTDRTAAIAVHAGATVVSHRKNMGVGAAFHTGIKEALKRGADVIANIDADGQFNPNDIPTLIKPVQSGDADFVTTTRFADKNNLPDMPAVKLWGNRMMVIIINFITSKKFTDVSCGFRAYSREAALRLTLFGHFTYTQETFIDLAFKNLTMTEIPLVVRGEREHGKSRVASNLWRYGLKAATIIFRAARDYRPHLFFGVPGLISLGGGLAGGLFLLIRLLNVGEITPYRSMVQLSGVLIIIGFLMLFLSLLADMMHRNRVVAEEAVYHARKVAYASK